MLNVDRRTLNITLIYQEKKGVALKRKIKREEGKILRPIFLDFKIKSLSRLS